VENAWQERIWKINLEIKLHKIIAVNRVIAPGGEKDAQNDIFNRGTGRT
jgi:hypothetical protein